MGLKTRLSLTFRKKGVDSNKLQKRKPIEERYDEQGHGGSAITPTTQCLDDNVAKSMIRPQRAHSDDSATLVDGEGNGMVTYEDLARQALQIKNSSRQYTKPVKQHPPMFPELPTDSYVSDDTSDGIRLINKLPAHMWCEIASLAGPAAAASLAFSSKAFRYKLGARPWDELNTPENKLQKIELLVHFDDIHQDHLLCFVCAMYHPRVEPGKERWVVNHVTKPPVDCPNARHLPLPRMRLTHGRELPFAFVQLVMRAHRHSLDHGVAVNELARKWDCKDSEWQHRVRFMIHDGHLLMRSTSITFARKRMTPSELRLLLYSRNDYAPYFSVCEHWHNGDLMKLCKCALSHVPEEGKGVIEQLRERPRISMTKMKTNYFPKLCDECKPLRRCPECPTEYLLELRFVEDKKDRITPFKHAIVVSRWSDLGDGTSPSSPEWAACIGQAKYDSFGRVTNSTLCSTFETAMSNGAPGQRALSLAKNGRPFNRLREDVY